MAGRGVSGLPPRVARGRPHDQAKGDPDVWAMFGPRNAPAIGSPIVRVYADVSEHMSGEALELFVDRQMAELMVENRDRDEPNRAGELPSSRSNSRP